MIIKIVLCLLAVLIAGSSACGKEGEVEVHSLMCCEGLGLVNGICTRCGHFGHVPVNGKCCDDWQYKPIKGVCTKECTKNVHCSDGKCVNGICTNYIPGVNCGGNGQAPIGGNGKAGIGCCPPIATTKNGKCYEYDLNYGICTKNSDCQRDNAFGEPVQGYCRVNKCDYTDAHNIGIAGTG
jgi:hypothetical protein